MTSKAYLVRGGIGSFRGWEEHTAENIVRYFHSDDRIETWGMSGVFWGGLWWAI